MIRYDCLELLANRLIDDQMIVATSLSTNGRAMAGLRKGGPTFYNLNMGLCTGFSTGLSLAFPNRKVIALDSDGSLMIDASVLISIGDLKPANLVVMVFDNQAYARMGPTATSRHANLEEMARGAGIERACTVRDIEEFEEAAAKAIAEPGPHFLVAKVETETRRVPVSNRGFTSGRATRERFVDDLSHLPDYGAAGKK
jgi:sulfopyruvate decarboxylase subunit beta